MNFFLEKSLDCYMNASLYGTTYETMKRKEEVECLINEIGKEMILSGSETLTENGLMGISAMGMISKIDRLHLFLARIFASNGYDFSPVDQFFLFMERAEFWVTASQNARHGALDRSMMFAAQNGDAEALKILLELGVPVDVRDGMALKLAVKRGNLKAINVLLNAGASLALDDAAAIVMANLYRHYDLVKYFHSLGADLKAREGRLLEDAVSMGDLEQINYLIENGVDPAIYGKKAVKLAHEFCNQEITFEKTGKPILVKLLNEGADPLWFDRSVLLKLMTKGKSVVRLLQDRTVHGKSFSF